MIKNSSNLESRLPVNEAGCCALAKILIEVLVKENKRLRELLTRKENEVSVKEKENKRLRGLLDKDSSTDLYGLNKYEEELLSVVGDFFRTSQDYSAVFFDVNNFRNFNNIYSHDAGDKVLKTLADVLKGSKRENDSVYRRGNKSDEFLAIIKGGSCEAKNFAERVLSSFWEKLSNEYPQAMSGLSAGICDLETALSVLEKEENRQLSFEDNHLLADKLTLLADEAMLAAKKYKYGKGNIIIYSPKQEELTLFPNY